MQQAQNLFPRYRPLFRGGPTFFTSRRNYWNQNNWDQNLNRGPSFSRGQNFLARRRFSRFGPNRWSSVSRLVCNQCRITRHSTNSCNQYANFRQQNYSNYREPGTGYFQPVAPPENYGYFQPIQSQALLPGYHPIALSATHRSSALPSTMTQAQTQNRQQHVPSIYTNINPSIEENIQNNQMQNTLATAQVEAPSVQAETHCRNCKMAKVPKKPKSTNDEPCLGRIYRTHQPFTIQVQILDTHFPKFRQKHGFQAQQISQFDRDHTNFDPPLPNPTWLHNFAPGDLYWIHTININEIGEWTARQVTLCEQEERTTIIGVVVLPHIQQRTDAQADLFVNTAELADSPSWFRPILQSPLQDK